MTTPADAAREGARSPDGRFGSYRLGESEASLAVADPSVAQASDTVSSLTPLVSALAQRFESEPTTEATRREVDALGQRLLEASETERPGYDDLMSRLDEMLDDEGDLSDDDGAAADALEQMKTFTSRENMRVVQDEHGGHLRVADGKPGYTCGDCGAGYATGEVMMAHKEQECDGAIEAERSGEDAETRQALETAASVYADAVTDMGPTSQHDFLVRMGWTPEQVADSGYGPSMTETDQMELSDAVNQAAADAARNAYEDGDENTDILMRTLKGENR